MRPIGSGVGSPFNPFIQSAQQAAWMIPFCNSPAGVVSGGVSPVPTAGMVAWFRKGTGQVGAGFCSQWTDQSGLNHHLLQATGAMQPSIPGDGTLLFDGLIQMMQCAGFTLIQPETVYFRGRIVTYSGAGQDSPFDGNSLNLMRLFRVSGTSLSQYAGSQANSGTLTAGVYSSVACVYNGASSTLRVDATTSGPSNAGAASAGGFTLGAAGAANFANLQVAEVIIYNVAHDATQQAAVIAYLDTK